MNPSFNQISTVDAAKMLGVDKTSVANWCRKGIINFIDVSEADSTVPRYVLTEEEVEKIKRAMRRHGKTKWHKHYKKDWGKKSKEASVPKDDSHIFLEKAPIEEKTEPVIESKAELPTSKMDADKITTTIMYIKDIKERLDDLEAEKAQLLNEYESLKKEVMDFI